MTDREILDLHAKLVSTRSVSGTEEAIADFVEEWSRERCDTVRRIDNSVVALHGKAPYVLLNSHLDTVPPCDGWTRDPYDVEFADGRVYGLGSNDAKGPLAALMAAFDALTRHQNMGGLALAMVEGEETRGIGTTNVLQDLKRSGDTIEAAIVGEPTGLDVAVAQKGLLIFELVASGTACHAARINELGLSNPISILAADIDAIANMDWHEVDSFLGPVSIQPTVIRGGEARNQVPGVASVVYDVRSTNAYSHDEMLERVGAEVASEVRVVSTRLVPVATDVAENIVEAAMLARPQAERFGSATMSDMVFMKGIPAIKVGPGRSVRSHTADEFILADELTEGARFYSSLVENYMTLVSAASNMTVEVES